MDIKFDFQNAQISKDEVINQAERLKSYLDNLCLIRSGGYNAPESFINLPFDNEMLLRSKKIVEEKGGKDLKYIVVIGIGGSNLGALAVYEAIFGKLNLATKNGPKILFLDTNDPRKFEDVKYIISGIETKNEFLINIISKSGSTTETIVNFEALYSFLTIKFGNIKDRVVVTTDINSILWDTAQKNNFTVLDIPKKVGGRFSVFSTAGVFPLLLAGVDIDKFFKGAKMAIDSAFDKNIENNFSLISAVAIFFHYQKSVNINNSFFFNPEMECVGCWYRQLLAESLGKKEDKDGNIANVGITPIISIGSVDLHSMAQLFLGGPKDKFTTFIYSSSEGGARVPEKIIFEGFVENIEGKSFSEVMQAICKGVKRSYSDNNLPYTEIILPKIDEYSLGYFMQFKMIETILLANLLNINAFDQPNVEEYKKETKRLLSL